MFVYIIGAILAFSILVIIHELGHFTLAKINGVKVEEFSIGMGPKLFGIKGKETEYLIKALPIGGYVKMLGEQEAVDDKRALSAKSPLQRLSIIAAGPIMNFIFAIFIFSVIATKGFAIPKISELIPGNPAEQVGLKAGDEIVKIDGEKVYAWDDLTYKVTMGNGKPMDLSVLRNGESKNFKVTPVKDEKEGRFLIGIKPVVVDNPTITQAIGNGYSQTKLNIAQTFQFFKNAFRGRVKAQDFGGPVTIIKVSGKVAQAGFWPLVNFIGFLSIQLAIFNVLPIPALDGGWILMILVELVTRKKLSDDKVGLINTIGFIFLMTLMLLVTLKDILIPIKF